MDERSRGPWPEPMRPEAFHGIAGEFVRTVEPHTEADPAALLLSFLAATGSAIGSGPHYRVAADRHPPRIWPIIVGDTASGRKGTSIGLAQAVVERADPTWAGCFAANVGSGEAVIWRVRDAQAKPGKDGEEVVVDAGVDDKRLFIVEEEFASVLRVARRESSVLSPVLRSAWGRDDLVHTVKHDPARATGAHVVVLGHITPDELRRELSASEAANGFANRFLFAMSRRSTSLPRGGNLDDRALDAIAERLAVRLDYARTRGAVRAGPTYWQAYEPRYPSLTNPPPGLAGALTGRGAPYVHRLAVLFALLDGEDCLAGRHALAALAVWDYCEASVLHLFGDESDDPLGRRLHEAIRAAGGTGITRTAIRDVLGRHRGRDEIDRALDALVVAGRVEVEKEPTSGAPRTIYRATEATEATEAPLMSLMSLMSQGGQDDEAAAIEAAQDADREARGEEVAW